MTTLAKTLIIGDVHGRIDSYYKTLQRVKHDSIQVGDFGFKKQHDWHLKNTDSEKHKVNFGNHDYIPYVNKPHSLGNYSWLPEKNIFTIRGAFSIDRANRTEGLDWFADEELNHQQQLECFDLYVEKKPLIVISHNCPRNIELEYFANYWYDKTNTTALLQYCFDEHQPKLWIFGHHHRSMDFMENGTRFICLAELETITIDTNGLIYRD